MEIPVSSARIFISDIEKDAIRSATVEHNKEIPALANKRCQDFYVTCPT